MQNKKEKIIVFDFDGVVCDSTDECMVTSWNAWQEWNNRSGFRINLVEFPDEEKAAFRKLRPYVRGAGEYYILHRSMQEEFPITEQKVFERLRDRWLNQLDSFKFVFYGARERLRRKDVESWVMLHAVFEEVIAVMKKLNGQNRLRVATLKDSTSVRLILEHYGVHLLPDHLLDESQISSKLEALNLYSKQEDLSRDNLIFLDDNVTHLFEPKKAGYNIFLTGWGASLEEHRQLAIKKNIPVIMNIYEGNL